MCNRTKKILVVEKKKVQPEIFDTYCKGELLCAADPNTRDRDITILSKNTNTGKCSLAQFFYTLKHTPYQVAGHKDPFQLIIVLILSQPHRIVFLVEMIPEVWNSHCRCVMVWVSALEVIHVKWANKQKPITTLRSKTKRTNVVAKFNTQNYINFINNNYNNYAITQQ